VEVRIADGVAHFAGLATCGSVWACPVCGPKIRQARAVEIGNAVRQAVGRGWGAEFLTLTSRHHRDQALAWLWDQTEASWKAVQQQRRWREGTAALGLRGFIPVREVTEGRKGHNNGWHVHRHMVVLFDRPLTAAQRAEFEQLVWEVWNAQLLKRGLDSTRGLGALVKQCTAAEGLGWYMAKVQGGSNVGLEMARGDLKQGRTGHRTPEQLLVDAVETGEVVDVRLWLEYEQASKGRRMLTWSRGLRAELLGDEEGESDEELAAAEVGGGLVVRLDGHAWRWIRKFSPGGIEVLEAAEQGLEALWAYLVHVFADAPPESGEWSMGGDGFTCPLGSPFSIAS
jgi:hypothetical protein